MCIATGISQAWIPLNDHIRMATGISQAWIPLDDHIRMATGILQAWIPLDEDMTRVVELKFMLISNILKFKPFIASTVF